MRSEGNNALRIALVAPLWVRVPPENYGGTELMLHLLCEDLVARGHDVTLFASGDSQTRARLHAIGDVSVSAMMLRGKAEVYDVYANAALAEAIAAGGQFDVIHCHIGCSVLPLAITSPVPVLFTLHICPTMDDLWALGRYRQIPVAAASRYQAAPVIKVRGPEVPVVYHGIDFGAFEFSPMPGKYLAFLGRMGPQKSPLDAIRIAQEVGMPLVLAGKPQNESEQAYFRDEIQPWIDGRQVTYLGPVDHARKNELLRQAAAMLFPIRGDEAFGLVMVEAMACGTPVVGHALATVPEVIDQGVTGFYSKSVEELPGLVRRALSLDRTSVRQHAHSRFDFRRMTDDYVRLYHSLRRKTGEPSEVSP